MPTFGASTFTVDRASTQRAYSAAGPGGADTCECAYCRNFRAVRAAVFPPAFLRFLEELGIDPLKDAEVYQCGRTEKGHNYGGWFHFVGGLAADAVLQNVPFGTNFNAHLSPATAPRITTLKDANAVQVDFFASAVPWRLDEEDPG